MSDATFKTGDTAYWPSTSGDAICCGAVMLANERTLVVEYAGTYQIRHAGSAWEQVYATAADAYRAAMGKHAKAIQEANRAMLAIVDSLHAMQEQPRAS